MVSTFNCQLLPASHQIIIYTRKSKQTALFYHCCYLGRHILLPTVFVLFYHLQHFACLHVQVAFVVVAYVFYFVVGNKVAIQVDKVGRRIKPQAVPYHAIAQGGVNKQLYLSAKQGGE